MFTVHSEYILDFVEVESYLRHHADEMLENINPEHFEFIRLGNSTDISWDPAAPAYRVLRNSTEYNCVDFWLTRTRDGRALLAMTTEGSTYSTNARSFNENAAEFEKARANLVNRIQEEGISDRMLENGRAWAAIDYESMYDAALRRTFHDNVPAKWQQMPHVTAL